jgi:hypothetical protein
MMVLTSFSLLMPAFSLVVAPPPLAEMTSQLLQRSPTTPCGVSNFGGVLEPRYIVCATAFDQ